MTKSRLPVGRVMCLRSFLASAALLAVVGCHQAQHGPSHKGCCPGGCHGHGVKNADYYEPRGQSPDDSQPDGRATTKSVSKVAASQAPVRRASAPQFTPADPRVGTENGQITRGLDESWMTGNAAQRYPDEYLLDGGDRLLPVHYDGYTRRGLDSEDTIGESIDRNGKRSVRPSNTVMIYAPRFAAVRSVTTPGGQESVMHVAGAMDARRDSGVKAKVGPQRYALNAGLKGLQTRSRVSGVESRSGLHGVGQVARLTEHKADLKGREEFSFAFRGQINSGQEAFLAAGIQAAMKWSQAIAPVIIAKSDRLQEVRASTVAGEMVGTEDRYSQPGELRLMKLADKAVAQPGDVVTFVLRFDNLGDKELRDVRIIDNLTPRLEFIEESATCDLPGEVFIEDNDEGSVVLTFKLDEPLAGRRAATLRENKGKSIKTGGVVTFQCRVR